MPPTKKASVKKPAPTGKAKTAKAKGAAISASSDDDDNTDTSGSSSKARSLVIVESPAKAKTIKKILGADFQIKASVGHIRDLPKKKLGVDVEHNFEPVYEVMLDKTDVVADLRAASKKCDTIYLAPDPDREGEAIAWHIAQLLEGLPNKKILRIEFHEITKNAILEAIQHPRPIDQARVDAQQARRVLDRLVGYKLSPLLWKKVTKGLSAGRVQSVAVRLICDREAEVQAFVPEEYWTVHCDLTLPNQPEALLEAELVKVEGKKPQLSDEATTQAVVNILKANPYQVSDVGERESKRNPVAPFITSSLQREASNRFGYAVKRTMQIAQGLYEGIELGSEGPVGLITYMRTDSTRVAQEAQEEAREYIIERYGKDYYPETPRQYTKKAKGAQDAHEAIRPTSVHRTPESLRGFLKDDQFKLYQMIWNRFVASQMEAARIRTKSVEISAGTCLLRASHSQIVFKGYMAVYKTEEDDDEKAGSVLPNLTKGTALSLKQVKPKQHFTEPPPRFTEASLVKVMEELGIGRPSTYAPTIATIQDRGYVLKVEKHMEPTELGKAVNKLLVEHFNDIVDVHFTAHLETKLDELSETYAKDKWRQVVGDFYAPFEATLKKANQEMDKVQVLINDETCANCGKPMALKTSRWGSQFLGCTGYPDCKTTKPLTKDMKPVPDDKPSNETCEQCQGPMVIRYGRYGEYLACVNEDCKAKRPIVIKTGVNCPQCQKGDIVQRKSHRGKIFYGCNKYPACNFALWNKPTGTQCPDCSSLLVEKVLKKGTFHACSKKECKFVEAVEAAETAPGT